MKLPHIVAKLSSGTWICTHIGMDGEKADAAYMAEVNGGADAAVYLARGGIRRRFKRSSVVVVAPVEAKPTEPAPVEAKAKKGAK